MRRVALSILLVSLLVGCPQEDSINPRLHAASVPAKDYFPLVKGATWTYVTHFDGPTSDDSTESATITQVVASGNVVIAQVESHGKYRIGDPTTNFYTYVKDPTGITATYSSGFVDTLVSFPLAVGTQSLNLATVSVNVVNGEEWRDVLGDVDQTIELGPTNWSEDCLSVTRTRDWSIFMPKATHSETVSTTVVFAPNIGQVRRITHYFGGQVGVRELATFSIPVH